MHDQYLELQKQWEQEEREKEKERKRINALKPQMRKDILQFSKEHKYFTINTLSAEFPQYPRKAMSFMLVSLVKSKTFKHFTKKTFQRVE